MAEIDEWIKKQLKKGYSKEQIKEGLRKAGYLQNTIDSVDSFARKKNFRLFPLLVIFLVIILVFFIVQQFPSSKVVDKQLMLSMTEKLSDSYSYPLIIESSDKEEKYDGDYFPFVNARLAKTYALLYEKTNDKKYLKLAEDNAEKVISFCGTELYKLKIGCDYLGMDILQANKILNKDELKEFINASYVSLVEKRTLIIEKGSCSELSSRASFFAALNNYSRKNEIDTKISENAKEAFWDAYYLIFYDLDTFVYDKDYEYTPIKHEKKEFYSIQCNYYYAGALADNIVNNICSEDEPCIKTALDLWELKLKKGVENNIIELRPALTLLDSSAELYEFSGDENFKKNALNVKEFIDSNLVNEFNGETRLTTKDKKRVSLADEIEYVYMLYKYDWLDNK